MHGERTFDATDSLVPEHRLLRSFVDARHHEAQLMLIRYILCPCCEAPSDHCDETSSHCHVFFISEYKTAVVYEDRLEFRRGLVNQKSHTEWYTD